MAKKLDSIGCSVFAGCLNANGDGAKKLESECSARLKVVPLDVASDESVKEAVRIVESEAGGETRFTILRKERTECWGDTL